MTLTLTQHPLAAHGQCMDPTGTLVCRMHETHDGWQQPSLDLGGLADDVTALYDHLNL